MNNEENVLKEYIDLTKKETCKIDFNLADVSILDDKIGGIPYLPVGESYPVDNEGNKMGLFMQINLDNIKSGKETRTVVRLNPIPPNYSSFDVCKLLDKYLQIESGKNQR